MIATLSGLAGMGRRFGSVTSRKPEDLPVGVLYRCFGLKHPDRRDQSVCMGQRLFTRRKHVSYARPGRKDCFHALERVCSFPSAPTE